jgi:hypothetical protein
MCSGNNSIINSSMQLDYWVMKLTEHQMGRDTTHTAEVKRAHRILIRKHEEKRSLGRPRHRCDNN